MKRADLDDNLRPERFNRLDPKTRDRLQPRYRKALRALG